MCSNGLNFTKINKKRKELLTSIFARFGSQGNGGVRTAAAGAGNIHAAPQARKTAK